MSGIKKRKMEFGLHQNDLAVPEETATQNEQLQQLDADQYPVDNLQKAVQDIIHPLLIPVVAENLAKYCNRKDFSSFRLVCTDWRDAFTSHFRSITELTFKPVKFYRYDISHYSADLLHPNQSSGRRTSMQDFLQFVANPLNQYQVKPYRQIKLLCWNFRDHFDIDMISREFWGQVYSNVTSLTLSHCYFRRVEEFWKIVYQGCPNLQSLSLVRNCFQKSDEAEMAENNSVYVPPINGENRNLKKLDVNAYGMIPIPVSWVELFSHFNQLDSFKINLYLGHHFRAVQVLEAIRTIRNHEQKLLPLKSFELYEYFPISGIGWRLEQKKSELNMLKELNLTDRHRQVYLSEMNNDEATTDFIKDFLQLHSNSLIKVECDRYHDILMEFPFGIDLFNLEEFTIVDTLGCNLEFLQSMKNLKRLTLGNNYYINDPVITDMISLTPETDQMSTFKLEKLKIFSICNSLLDVEQVKRLTGWFPNVEQVEMPLNNEQFVVICGNWRKNLRELTVIGRELTDEGITGIGRESDSDNDPQEEDLLLDDGIRAGITCLKGLRSFCYKSPKLAEATVVEILKLPELQKLKLSGRINLSNETRQLMENKVEYETYKTYE